MRNLINTKIVLTPEEQMICEHIGIRRYNINRQKGVTDKKIGKENNYKVNFLKDWKHPLSEIDKLVQFS